MTVARSKINYKQSFKEPGYIFSMASVSKAMTEKMVSGLDT